MTAAAGSEAAELPVARRILILLSTVLTTALYFTTILVASTVLPQMQGTFSATADEISWTMTFNNLATAIVTPATGWLSTRFGRRNVMIWATALFTVSTAMCGLATSLETMVFWRIVQGASGAPAVPLVQTILLDVFPPRQHRVVLGIYGMGVVLGPILGPTIGGYLAESVNWRWAFHVLVPFGVAATAGLTFALPRDERTGPVYLSWTGFILLSVAIGGLQWALSRGERLDWLESTEIRISLLTAGVAFYAFVVHSLTSPRPFLDLRLLLDRNYALGLGLITIFGMLNFTPMVLLPALMRTHMGYSDELIGQVVGSRGFGGLLGFFAVMFIERLDPRVSVGFGFMLQIVAGWWLMTIDLNVTPLELMLNGAVQGFSSGLLVVALTLTTFPGIPRERMAEASAVYHLLRNIGASIFISISVAEMVRSTGMNYARMTEIVTPYNRALGWSWVMGSWSVDGAAGLARIGREMSRQSALIALVNAFGIYTIVAAFSIPLVLLLKRQPEAQK